MPRNVTTILLPSDDAAPELPRQHAPVEEQPQTPAGYGLSNWCVIPLVLAIAISAIGPYVVGRTSEPRALAFSLGGLLVGAVFWSWVIYLIFGRTRKAADVGFTVVIALATLTRIVAPGLNLPMPRQASAFGMYDAPAAPEPAPAKSIDSHLEKAVTRWQKTANQLDATYNKVEEEFRLSGDADPATLHSHVEITQRMGILNRLSNAHSARVGYLATASDTIAKFLTEQGLPPEDVKRLTAEFNSSGVGRDDAAYAQAMTRRLQASTAILQLLKDRYGQWEVAQDGVMHFKREVDAGAFNQLRVALQESLATLTRINAVTVVAEEPATPR